MNESGSTDNIRGKSINGFKWAILDNLACSGITFVVGLVLAHWLGAEEFGILGIMTIFINLSMTIVDGGFVTALIRKLDADERDYNTVFYSNLAISLVLTFLLIVSSPWIANFFGQDVLAQTLPVISFLLVVNALTIIPKAQFTKAIDFRRQAIASLISSLFSGFVGIGLAVLGYGVWALVWQQMSRQIVLLLCLWAQSTWRPRLQFSMQSFRELFGFGSKILLANFINSLYKDIFLAVIAKLFTARQLGYYNRADQFNLIFSNNLSTVIQRVSMPTFSLLQNDVDRFRNTYRHFTILSAMFTFALVFGLAAAADTVIITLLGQRWLPAAPYLRIMSLYAAIYPLQQLNLNILNVMKRSDWVLRLEIIKKAIFLAVITVGIFYGMMPMLWAAVAYYYVEFVLNSWYSHRLIGYGTMAQIRDVLPLYLASGIISVAVWALGRLPVHPYAMLVCQVVLATVLHSGWYLLIRQPQFMAVLATGRERFRSIMHRGADKI